MTPVVFLAEWALRSSILILCGAVLLRAFRLKDASLRLAAWVALLLGSLAIPALTAALPVLPVAALRTTSPRPTLPIAMDTSPYGGVDLPRAEASPARPIDWSGLAVLLYAVVAGALLLRLGAGAVMSSRLLRRSRPTGRITEGIEIRESDLVSAPVTLGILRSAVVLPGDWREWDETKLEAVLAHERSHVRRRDPAVQLISALHRALLWHTPLSWFLHRSIVRVAEEASDDAAVAAACDRAGYAAVLLEFMRRGVRGAAGHGVAMARYGCPDERIRRILNGTTFSRGVTLRGAAAILALVSPIAYVVAAAHPQRTEASPAPAPIAVEMPAAEPQAAPAPPAPPAQSAKPAAPAEPHSGGALLHYLIVNGDNTSGSWDASDATPPFGARYGRHFAWFRQDGNEYIITDAGVLAELDKAMEPQKAVNRMQGEVNAEQARVNAMQSQVNALQGEVNALQKMGNRRQDMVNQIQSSASREDNEELIRKLQEAIRELRAGANKANQQSVNQSQSQVNGQQSRVNAEQSKVNALQSKVNEEQHRASEEINRRLREIFDSAVRRRLVQRLM